MRASLLLVATLAVTLAAGPAGAQTPPPRGGQDLGRAQTFKGAELTPKACVAMEIACGETVTSRLTQDDCKLPSDGSLYDVYYFSGQSGQTVTIDLSSNAFDAYLGLFDPDQNVVAQTDDGGGGTDARLVHTLDETSLDWAILANAYPGESGRYDLTLQCSGGPPPPPPPPADGFFSDPAYPDFRFRVTIGEPGDTRMGTREPSCLSETVCVSGALPGRSEAFLRIIGPRPNGFLWPTIVRFTPARLVVDIRQLSTGDLNTYVLPAVPPGVDELPGLQDRMGFLP